MIAANILAFLLLLEQAIIVFSFMDVGVLESNIIGQQIVQRQCLLTILRSRRFLFTDARDAYIIFISFENVLLYMEIL